MIVHRAADRRRIGQQFPGTGAAQAIGLAADCTPQWNAQSAASAKSEQRIAGCCEQSRQSDEVPLESHLPDFGKQVLQISLDQNIVFQNDRPWDVFIDDSLPQLLVADIAADLSRGQGSRNVVDYMSFIVFGTIALRQCRTIRARKQFKINTDFAEPRTYFFPTVGASLQIDDEDRGLLPARIAFGLRHGIHFSSPGN